MTLPGLQVGWAEFQWDLALHECDVNNFKEGGFGQIRGAALLR